jgi:hypothetical protein
MIRLHGPGIDQQEKQQGRESSTGEKRDSLYISINISIYTYSIYSLWSALALCMVLESLVEHGDSGGWGYTWAQIYRRTTPFHTLTLYYAKVSGDIQQPNVTFCMTIYTQTA